MVGMKSLAGADPCFPPRLEVPSLPHSGIHGRAVSTATWSDLHISPSRRLTNSWAVTGLLSWQLLSAKLQLEPGFGVCQVILHLLCFQQLPLQHATSLPALGHSAPGPARL